MDDDDRSLLPTVSVRGDGVVDAVPDEARLGIQVVEEARSRDAALDAVRRRMGEFEDMLDRLGIPDEARDTTIRVGEKGERKDNRWLSKGFHARVHVGLTLETPDVLSEIVTGAVDLADAEVNGPSWSLSRDHPAMAEAYAAAASDARRKAEAYAAGVGASLGAPIRIVEPGVRTISPVAPEPREPAPQAMAASMPAAARRGGSAEETLPELDLRPPKRKVTASVEVMFRLEHQ